MRITIIGAGNLGYHLATGLAAGGGTIVQIFNRNRPEAEALAELTDAEPIDELSLLNSNVDLVLIAVHDDAISHVASEARIYLEDKMIAHTAGSVTSLVLHQDGNYGVFYPLQTFSKARGIDWSKVPILITANNLSAIKTLRTCSSLLSKKNHVVTDDERLALHLAAAIANNFSNHMFTLAEQVAVTNGLDFELLKPLIAETSAKVMEIPPKFAQTGPAVRGDEDTMAKHRQLLLDSPELMRLYNTISESISRL